MGNVITVIQYLEVHQVRVSEWLLFNTKVLSFILARGEGVLNIILTAKFINDLAAVVAVIIW
jgi:hypothetical protein